MDLFGSRDVPVAGYSGTAEKLKAFQQASSVVASGK